MEELGYALAPVPFLSNAAAGLLIQAAGSDEQKQRWLPGLASGELTRRGGAAERRRGQAGPGRGRGRRDRAVRRRRRARGRALRRRASSRWRRWTPPAASPACAPTAAARRSRASPGPGIGAGAAGGLGRADRRGPAGDGDGRGVRARPQAVRPADRRLPGRVAPLRADAARDRGRALGDLLRRLDGGRRAGDAGAGRLDGEGVRLGRGLARVLVVAAGARRDRLHVGARPPLLPQAGEGRRAAVGQRERAPRARGRACPRSGEAAASV